MRQLLHASDTWSSTRLSATTARQGIRRSPYGAGQLGGAPPATAGAVLPMPVRDLPYGDAGCDEYPCK